MKKSYKLIVFDWKEIPDIKEIQSAVKNNYKYFYDAETESDFYCWVVSKTKLTRKEVQDIFNEEFNEE